MQLNLIRKIGTMKKYMAMKQNKLIAIEKEIRQIKQQLLSIGEMRPGSLTLQYNQPKGRSFPYYQLSYTHNMKSRTDYIRKEFVDDLKMQIKNYKLFRKLTKRWVDLAIKYSKLKIDFSVKNK